MCFFVVVVVAVVSLLALILLVIMICHFTEKKHQLDIDWSGMGSSIFTDIKSTTFIEVCFYQYM